MKRLLLATLVAFTLPVFAATSAYENNLPTSPVPTGIYHHVTHIHHIAGKHKIGSDDKDYRNLDHSRSDSFPSTDSRN